MNQPAVKSSNFKDDDVYNFLNLLTHGSREELTRAIGYLVEVKNDMSGLACDRLAAGDLLKLIRKARRGYDK